jgi:hypothetical protein
MRRRLALVIQTLLVAVAVLWVSVGVVDAAGPWQAQVVSAETKEPLEGVVVLAWWTRHVRSLGGPSEEYRDSQEIVTDQSGRFIIAPRSFFSLNPLVFFRGPFFALFKPGYGQDRWPGYEERETWSPEKRKKLGMYSNLLELDGVVLEMPRLQSIEERREYLGKLRGDYLVVPPARRPLLQGAIAEERRTLGYRSVNTEQ